MNCIIHNNFTGNFYKMIQRILLCFLIISGCSKDPSEDSIYLAANGVTIICDASGRVGDTFEVKGVTYTIVDEMMLREMINSGEDVTKVCTTRVTDMSELFLYQQSFNQDISFWDVSNVTNMYRMFEGSWFNQDINSWDVGNVTDMSAMFSTHCWVLGALGKMFTHKPFHSFLS